MSTTEPEDADCCEVGMPTWDSESQGHWTWLREVREQWSQRRAGFPLVQGTQVYSFESSSRLGGDVGQEIRSHKGCSVH